MNVINNFFKDDYQNDNSNFIMVEVEEPWPVKIPNESKWMASIRNLLDEPDFIKDFHDMLHPLKKMIKHREFKGQSPKLSTTKKAWHNILLKDAPKIVQKWHDLLHPFQSDLEFETDEDEISNEIIDDDESKDKNQDPMTITKNLIIDTKPNVERDFNPNPNAWIHKDLIGKGFHEDGDNGNDVKEIEYVDYEDTANPWFTHHNEIKDIDGPPPLQLENDLQNEHPDFIPDLRDGSLHPVRNQMINEEASDLNIVS